MKTFIIGLLIGAILSGAAVWRFHAEPPATEAAHEEEHPKELAEHEKDGTVSVKIEEAGQKQMGLRFEVLTALPLQPETQAYGRVLNAAELPLLLAEINVAEVGLKGSKLAYDRLKRLNGEAGTVSEQKVEEAQEAMKKDEVALQSAHVKLVTTWGETVAGRSDIQALAEQITANAAALVRLDLPPGLAFNTKTARVALPGSEDKAMEAEVLGPAPTADPVTQSASLICLIKAKGWVPGTAVIGWLHEEGAKAESAIAVPRTALLRHEGVVFVYLRHEDEFTRSPVDLTVAMGDKWLAKGGLKAGDEVVVAGAQQLLSEELKGQTEED
ncbi:MAG: hypothetical protein JWO08_747 [Verrucomicrobiaceae bacterium]|nr:hypothetical protein [Verrucomicrobiaceae bacterium]